MDSEALDKSVVSVAFKFEFEFELEFELEPDSSSATKCSNGKLLIDGNGSDDDATEVQFPLRRARSSAEHRYLAGAEAERSSAKTLAERASKRVRNTKKRKRLPQLLCAATSKSERAREQTMRR